MFAEIVSLKLKPASADEVRKLTEQKIAPWLRGRRGFHGLHMAQVGDAEMIVFNTWSGKADADASVGEEERLIQQTIGHLLSSPPSFSRGQIVVHAPGHEPLHSPEMHPS